MKVVFRTDASARMGLGHLLRSLSLAHAVRSLGADVVFVTRGLGFDSAGYEYDIGTQ